MGKRTIIGKNNHSFTINIQAPAQNNLTARTLILKVQKLSDLHVHLHLSKYSLWAYLQSRAYGGILLPELSCSIYFN